MDKDDKFTIEDEDEDNDYVFNHDEAIERYLNNPDAVIADFTGHRFVFGIRSGYITDDGIADVEDVIRDTVINYEYTFHRMNVRCCPRRVLVNQSSFTIQHKCPNSLPLSFQTPKQLADSP